MATITPAGRAKARPGKATADAEYGRADALHERAHFFKCLSARNLKLTRQRKAVVEEILNHNGHFEADEIVLLLKEKRIRVSRATVYRTLELLMESRLVQKLDFGDSGSLYEHFQVGGHHDHLICTECGRVIEFHDRKLERAQSGICAQHDFEESHHSLRIFGVCGRCRGKGA